MNLRPLSARPVSSAMNPTILAGAFVAAVILIHRAIQLIGNRLYGRQNGKLNRRANRQSPSLLSLAAGEGSRGHIAAIARLSAFDETALHHGSAI